MLERLRTCIAAGGETKTSDFAKPKPLFYCSQGTGLILVLVAWHVADYTLGSLTAGKGGELPTHMFVWQNMHKVVYVVGKASAVFDFQVAASAAWPAEESKN
jgi:hypothetical protein